MDLMPFTDALPTNAPAHVFYSDPSVATPLSERFPIDNSLANVLPVAGPDRLQSLASMSPLPRSVSSVLGLLVRASQEQKMGHDLQADRLSSHVARGWKCSLPAVLWSRHVPDWPVTAQALDFLPLALLVYSAVQP